MSPVATGVANPTASLIRPPATTSPQDIAAAYAAVRAFYGSLDTAINRRDTSDFFRATSADCGCRKGIVEEVDSLKAKKQTVDGGDVAQLAVRGYVAVGNFAQVSAYYNLSAGTVHEVSGKAILTEERIVGRQDVLSLVHTQSGWIVAKVTNLTQGSIAGE